MKTHPQYAVAFLGWATFFLLQFAFSQQAKAQISDFTTDSPYLAQTLNIIHRPVSEPACIEEFDYHVGINELIVFGLRTVNMGPHDAGIVDALDTTGLFWDACHYHWHLDGWNECFLLNACGDTIKKGGKVGWNLRDGGNFVQYINSSLQGAAFGQWVSQYGVIDYGLLNHPPNTSFNGDTRMGVSSGYYDTYPENIWGNSIRTDSVPNGDYYFVCKGNFSRYFNQGLNIFPDAIKIPIRISGIFAGRGSDNSRQIEIIESIAPCLDTLYSSTITALTSNGIWGTGEIVLQDMGIGIYPVQRVLVDGNQLRDAGTIYPTTHRFFDYNVIPGQTYRYRHNGILSNKVKRR